ncbi:hypothetical protein Pst134EA_019607 [Puccinia striiformis f. sp. tritici]|uniref:hypothetical protein n=1 Tax=Puccinia striiformis f. sp. tritici TaxID=168172 RepID=UPI0020086044|nr:hypothetical protein Pst134EA_019607 [Puccinia striiformis f. sp. tritici]KAH9459454.1 hypothetical protein Pst134EA_019607 [Puccinia striiformis f. sp. tritici]
MLKASKRPSLPTGSRTCTLRFLRIPLSLHGPSSASTHTSAPTEPIKSIEWQINELNYPLHRSPSGDYSSINSLSSQKSRLTTPQEPKAAYIATSKKETTEEQFEVYKQQLIN